MAEYPFLQPRESDIIGHPATHEILKLLTKKDKINFKDIRSLAREKLESKDEKLVEQHAALYVARLEEIGLLQDAGWDGGSKAYSLNKGRLKEIIGKAENLAETLKGYEKGII